MSNELTTVSHVAAFDPNQQVTFDVNTEEIARFKSEYLALKINGPDDIAGHEAVHKARMACVRTRSTIEKQRKEYKASALAYGRSVDAAAKKITAEIEPVEKHLVSQEEAYRDACEKIKAEQEARKQRALQDRVDKLAAVGCVMNSAVVEALTDSDFAAMLSELSAAYEQKQAEERRLEADRIEEERKAQEAKAERELQEAERRRIEGERLAAERRELEEQRRKLEAERNRLQEEAKKHAAEQRRLADEQAAIEDARRREQEERDLAELIEREKAEAAERARAEERKQVELQEAERKRIAEEAENRRRREEAMRPDKEKLISVAVAVNAIAVPEVSDSASRYAREIEAVLSRASFEIANIVKCMGES